jgi:hypothetical protein
MVRKQTTTVYICDVCGGEYDTEGEAQQCENVPITKGNVNSEDEQGNKFKFNDWEVGKKYWVKGMHHSSWEPEEDEYILCEFAQMGNFGSHHMIPLILKYPEDKHMEFYNNNMVIKKVKQ